MKNRILLIEKNQDDQTSFVRLVRGENFSCYYAVAGSFSEARDIISTERFDIVVSDYMIGGGTVFDIFELLNDTPVIVVSQGGNEGVAVKVMKAGAYDYLIKDPERNYLKVLPVTIENAIKRKKADKRLQLLESAVVNANDAIIILEAEPNELLGRRIIYVNEAFTGMTGYSYEEATTQTMRILRGPETSLTVLDKIRVALEKCSPVRVELINYRKDGTKFWVECNIVPFADEKGVFSHWVSVQRDISERKQAEEERERLIKEIEAINADLTELNQELETIGAERTMSLMALTVADRIRNPASMIGGRCRRILLKEEISEEMRKSLKYVLEGADKLDTIVKDFEEFLKIRQSQFVKEDLNKIIESVTAVSEKEASFKGIDMVVHMTEGPLKINMQKDLLRVAVFHVIKNAIEATSKGGKVSVETSIEDENVILDVSDTGYGIPEQEVGNVFKPFFSTKERGFGLGLPLVKQIITEHLGEVTVKSSPGRGSTFQIKFPVRWKEGVYINNE